LSSFPRRDMGIGDATRMPESFPQKHWGIGARVNALPHRL